MEMNRNELLNALRAITPGLAKGDSLLPGSDSVAFRNSMVQSYNNALSVTYPLDCRIEAIVRAAEMIKALDGMKGDMVDIILDGQSLRITCGRSRLSMRLLENPLTLGLLDALDLEDQEWELLPSNFLEALTLCLPSVFRDISKGAIAGIRIEGDSMLSTDNFRATWVDLDQPMEPGFTLPGPAATQLVRMGSITHWSLAQAWVHFLSQVGAVFSSRLLATEYPTEGLKKKFPEPSGQSYQFPEGMATTVAWAGVLSSILDDNTDYITISENNGLLLVRGERSYGSIDIELPVSPNTWPPGIAINIQPGYLLDILARTQSFTMEGQIAHFQGKGFQHIIATIILD